MPRPITLLSKWRMAMAIVARYGGCGTTAIGLRLLDHYNVKTSRLDPSYEVLAGAARMTRRNAINCVDQLVADGFLKIVERRKGTSNVFDFDWHRAGEMDFTTSGEADFTTEVKPNSPTGETHCTATSEVGFTQNLEVETEKETIDAEANETDLDSLISDIELESSGEVLRPRREGDRRSAQIEVERCLRRLLGAPDLTMACPASKLVSPAVMTGLTTRCLRGALTETDVSRVIMATGGYCTLQGMPEG